MALFKIAFHCGQVNTYVVEEHESKEMAFDKWQRQINGDITEDVLMRVGDVLICPKQITFVVIEEVVAKEADPAAGTTVDV